MAKTIALSFSQNLLHIITITLFFFTALYSNHVQSQTNDTYNEEKTILLQLMDQWFNPRSSSSDHCSWPEITCTNGSVTGINFQQPITYKKIPPVICNLKNLISITLTAYFNLEHFPTFLSNCSKLKHLDLSGNFSTGIIQENIDGLLLPSHLEYLDLSYNYFSGLPAAIGHLSSLKCLNLSHSQFSGEILPEFGNLSNLSYLDLSFSGFSGAVLREIGHLSNLIYMNLSSNGFSGAVPGEIGHLSNLIYMDLSSNGFSGVIPPEFGNLSNLSYLDLSYNRFVGTIPSEIGRLLNLSYMDLSANTFFSNIPPEIGSLSSLRTLDLSYNKFSGEIPPEIGHLSSLGTLDLSYNKFSGEIPPEIGHLSSLGTLDLSDNKFSGEIPPEIGHLSSLGTLDLSDNEFSGEVPSEIWLPHIYSLDLSYNRLCLGCIPPKFNKSTIIYLEILPVCLDNPNHLSNSKSRFAAILSTAIVAVLLIMVFTFYILRRFNFKRYKLDLTWKLVVFQKLNFTEEIIFSSLTDTNLIGSGGSGNVYKVEINSSGEYVAVKKIHDNKKFDKRLEKQFLSEVQILGTIRHLNILKLMCYLSSRNSKLLVYEYMENGSLDQWIHSKNASIPNVVLEWPKRLKIAIATADGLCYMHHYSSSPIIHRDLKSSNILLDSEFNAKIADFGLARILENNGVPRTMSVVAGTFGYIAPEYAQTARVTEKVDVYSFGVILLELVTGRRAHRGDENSSLVEWAWNHIQQEKQIVDALDEKIKEPNYLDEMIKVFKLGIYCTNALPSRRPKMNEVVQILHRCANPLAPGQNLIPEFRESVPHASKLVFLYQNLLKFRVFKLSNRSA